MAGRIWPKAEHAVDLETGAIVAVTLQGADQGDTTTITSTVVEAVTQLKAAAAATDADVETAADIVTDKGYHSRAVVLDLASNGFRTYLSEPDRGPQVWTDQREARDAVYANRRRVRGPRGKRFLRRRGELVERTFAHVYDTGGMRRTHLRRHENILKRLLIHAGGFNLGLVMRQICGVGKPRRLQGVSAAAIAALVDFVHGLRDLLSLDRRSGLFPWRALTYFSLATGC